MANYSRMVKSNLIKGLISSIMVIISLIWIGTSFVRGSFSSYNYFMLRHLDESFAIYGAACFLIAIALFCLRFLLKYLMINPLVDYKGLIINISKVFQMIHIPVALLGVAFIAVHVYIALIMGFKFSATYIMGVITIIDMILLLITSTRRIFNKAVKGHKFLGVLFVILFLAHVLTFKIFGIN